MTEQERKVIAECFGDSINCAINIVYETIATIFEEVSKHKELTQEEMLIAISVGLKMLIKNEVEE